MSSDPLGVDLLTDETKRRRRNLDIVASIALVVVLLNLEPTRISVLGIDFGEQDQQRLLWLLLIVDLAFLALFLVYASIDLARTRVVLGQAAAETRTRMDEQGPRKEAIREAFREAITTKDDQQIGAMSREDFFLMKAYAQVDSLAVALRRAQDHALFRRFGVVRAIVDLGLPAALAVTAAVALGVEL